jgi:hypothetical protein
MLAWASTYEGRALADLGEADRGLSMMREGVAVGRVTGSSLFESFQLALFAEAQLRKGLYDESAQTLDEALAVSERSGEQFSASELRRLRGELRLATSRDVGSPCGRGLPRCHRDLTNTGREAAHVAGVREPRAAAGLHHEER